MYLCVKQNNVTSTCFALLLPKTRGIPSPFYGGVLTDILRENKGKEQLILHLAMGITIVLLRWGLNYYREGHWQEVSFWSFNDKIHYYILEHFVLVIGYLKWILTI